MKRLGLIGPLLPYRGGIAHHTTMLHRSLSSRAHLLTISFKRLYPGWLYPGRSDREPGYEGHREGNVKYLIDSLNPLTWLKTCRMLVNHAPQMVIFPWWTAYWAPCFGFMASYLRRRKIEVLFICHNVVDHESAPWKRPLSRVGLSGGDYFAVHTKSDAEALRALVPGAQVVMHPHPMYTHYPPPKNELPRRARLEVLFFGFVRPYKGLDVLIDAMSLLKEEDVFLSIVGEWWSRSSPLRQMIREAAVEKRVEVIDRYVTEGEAADYFARADVVVMPYHKATGSGIVTLAYHYGKPVIASDVGGFSEVVSEGVSGRLVAPGDAQALAEAMRGFLDAKPEGMREGIKEVSGRMTWEGLVESILGFTS